MSPLSCDGRRSTLGLRVANKDKPTFGSASEATMQSPSEWHGN
eukprot:CAMPEP_0117547708 /NCGR_PEP_ID=MMETSP0784-20121206/47267_1 /TAXON_ID=39447 /ORGANISM="" /LENGTH=42 /DNA_ID= /DNA_START= /DNA_END= /DNA_ORIENTATION=